MGFLTWWATMPFQSTPPARGATARVRSLMELMRISIHAPREGGDYVFAASNKTAAISIHAPREGGDCTGRYIARPCRHFNPRPREGGDALTGASRYTSHISIHAPREGGDLRVFRHEQPQ